MQKTPTAHQAREADGQGASPALRLSALETSLIG